MNSNDSNISDRTVLIDNDGAIQLHARANSVSGKCFMRLLINKIVVYESFSVTGKYIYLWSPIFYVKKGDSVIVTIEAPDGGNRYAFFYS